MKREGCRLAVLTIVVASTLGARVASGEIDRLVTLYSEPGFGGAPVVLKYDTPKLELLDFDDRAASVLLPTGVTASLYTGTYYSGTCVSVRESQSSLPELLGEAGVSSVRIGQDCTALSADGPRAALYDESDIQLTVVEDVPDLGAVGFGARATGIQFPDDRAPHAIAVYSGVNYGGTCETFVASASLEGTTIGANTIRSLRLNYTCDGPVRSTPVITGLDVAYSTVDDASAVCPSGYSRDAQDLNAGTHDDEDSSPGHYIHACVKYGPLVASHSFLTDIWIGVVGDLQSWSSACYPAPSDDYDPIQVPENLNGGAGGEGLTFCYAESTFDFPPPGAFVVRDLGFISFPDWWDAIGRDFQGRCETELGQTENVEYYHYNLNNGTDFIGDDDAIFLCEWKPVQLFDSSNPYLFTPAGVKTDEDPYDADGTKVRYGVSAYDREGTALTPQCSPGSSDELGFYTLVPHGQTSATVSCTATDADGRSKTAGFTVSVTPFDPANLPPTITAKADSNGQPYTGEWTRNAVVVSFTCQDGVGKPLDSVTPPVTFDREALNGAVFGTCTDAAGNIVGTSFGDINIDRTPPTVVGRGNGLAGPAWFNRPFQIVWEGHDAFSGVGQCDAPDWYLGPDSAAIARTGKCADRAGNVGTGSFLFAYDSTPPVVTAIRAPAPDAAGWNNTDVVVRATGGDALSGIDTCTSATISSDGRDQSATVSCRDRAGNFGHASIGGINVDKTGPLVKAEADRGPDSAGWYRKPFTVTWTGQDSKSGMAGCSAPITYAGPDTTAGQLEGYCDDVAGNRTQRVFPFRYDTAPPQVAIVSAPTGPINAPTVFRWAAADAAAAPSSLQFRHRFSGLLPGAWSEFGSATTATFTPSADGQYTLDVEARDQAGNVSAPATHGFTVDVSGPAIEIAVPANGASYVRFTEVLARYSCADGGAGMESGSCLGDVPNGSPIPAQAAGSHSFAVKARDALGNVSSRSVGYQIVNPMPVVTKFAPAAVTAGEVSTLEISGAAFVPETEVWLHSPEAQYRPVSSWSISADLTRIDVGLPRDLEPGAWTVSVSNSGGFGPLVVRLMLFVAPRGAVVSEADVSSDGSATIGGGGPGTPGSLSVSGTGGEGTLAVAEYASNPGGGVSFSSSGAFFDAYVGPGSTYTSVTITACDLNGGNFVEWWDGTRWLRAFPQSFDAASGCVTLTLTDLSSPRLSQLTGTIFGAGIDSTPPTTTAAGVAEDGPYTFGAWTSRAVSVTLSAADDPGGSGVARTAYRIDSGAEQTYAGPIALPNEGAFTLEYWSEDRTGNVEPPRSVAVRIDRTPPLLSLPPDQLLEATGPEGAIFSYAAAGHDALAGPVTPSCAPASGSVVLLGGTTVTCSAADPAGNAGKGSFDITVRDTTAPAIRSLTLPNGGVLWPPNHRMVPLTVTADATDAVSTAVCTIHGVSSSEAADGSGDGHTSADWRITGPLSVELRAERSGGASGRTYTLTVGCADASGNRSTGTVAASVPHGRR